MNLFKNSKDADIRGTVSKREERNIFLKKLLVYILDAMITFCAYLFALWVRFDFSIQSIPEEYLYKWLRFSPFAILIMTLVFLTMRMYDFIWHYVSARDCIQMGTAVAISNLFTLMISMVSNNRLPMSVYCIAFLVCFLITILMRSSLRVFTVISHIGKEMSVISEQNIMIIGAGAAGRMIMQEIRATSKIPANVVCLIDDNPSMKGKHIQGVTVIGGREHILSAVERYGINFIILAMPSAPASVKRDLLNICKITKCKIQTVPGVYQLINGEVSISKLRDVSIEDLLGRDSIKVNNSEIMGYVENKVVLVTGGGGSIGSELCRQIASHHPKQLIIFDIYENNAYDIQQELIRKYKDALHLTVLIGSVRDMDRLENVFSTYHPEIVYHAAAHKHVPLMEVSPCEAIKNNVFGTFQTAKCADKYGVKRFVLISTDKAVNPTNVMGATKRMCEMVIQTWNRQSKTDYVAVRFGNVLGSNGSVIPLFKKQISEGGPLTVTHPDIIRYFMTIPEAVSLVLQAGAYAKGGEIFILDMGEPVKIDDLARNLIRLSGYEPNVDIQIKYTGLRPGEKLYEELLMAEEGMQDTENKLIHIGKPIDIDTKEFQEKLENLRKTAFANDEEHIREAVANTVPTYHPSTE